MDIDNLLTYYLVLQYIIYGLVDPRNYLVRYIGQSSTGLIRPSRHKNPGVMRYDQGPRSDWLQELHELGLSYEIVVLEEVIDPYTLELAPCWWNADRNPTRLHEAERWWIAYGRASGWDLLNLTDGGEGTHGKKHSELTRSRIGTANSGKTLGVPKTAGHREKIGRAHRGIPKPSSRQTHLGIPKTPEHRAKISKAALRRWNTQELLDFMKGPNNPARSQKARAKISKKARERKNTKSSQTPSDQIICGTLSGYNHAKYRKRKGLDHCGPCESCKQARREYRRALYERMKSTS